ncbi:hypothetical protein HPB47_028059 [Ixodes persulcatus]|uniref:Uncharacterized protein n=1 Tax=Ixodes persulcatus TaxID=34615 RepID=A0AC60PUH0_IXOPE|nr:hypothetical protein HPB47_028059 [Ixodes persulcatus]
MRAFQCHGGWQENGKNYLITGLKGSKAKFCFVFSEGEKMTQLSGLHDTCRRTVLPGVTGNLTFNISAAAERRCVHSEGTVCDAHCGVCVLAVADPIAVTNHPPDDPVQVLPRSTPTLHWHPDRPLILPCLLLEFSSNRRLVRWNDRARRTRNSFTPSSTIGCRFLLSPHFCNDIPDMTQQQDCRLFLDHLEVIGVLGHIMITVLLYQPPSLMEWQLYPD